MSVKKEKCMDACRVNGMPSNADEQEILLGNLLTFFLLKMEE